MSARPHPRRGRVGWTDEEVVRRPDPGRRPVRHGAGQHGHERVDLRSRGGPRQHRHRDAERDHLLHAHDGGHDAARREARRHLGSPTRARDRLDRLRDRLADDRVQPEHGRAVPGLVDHRGPRRGARDPGDRGAPGRQLRGSRSDHRVRRDRRRLRRGRRRRTAHRRLHDDLLQLAVRVRRRGRDHGLRRDLRAQDRREDAASEHPHRRAERPAVGVRPGRRRVRDAAEQDLGLDRAAALPRDQRRRDRSARASRSPRGSS